jgi:GTPase SAR1 family protein
MATLCKLVLAGEKNSGKSTLLRCFGNESSDTKTVVKPMMVGGRPINVQLCELLELRDLILNAFDLRTKGALVVYDVTNHQSFLEAQYWVRDLRRVAREDMVIMLVGNKTDLSPQTAVPTEEARSYAEHHGLLFIEVSALNGTNTDLMIDVLVSKINTTIISSLVDLKPMTSSRCY